MPDSGRPLSPHLTVYRWPITMTLSILHRATGVALSVGLIVLVAWLVAAASGPGPYEEFVGLLDTGFGRFVLIGFSAAFFFHLGNGTRHLIWDLGVGFEKSQANASSWVIVVMTVVATVAFWLVV